MKVSAVVPVYNSSNTLERAIKSLLIQQEINEIFIVDDGSSDGSFALALQLEMEYGIIKVLTHEGRINQGASASRNFGLKHCRNEWIQFLDADDELMNEKVSEQLLLVEDNVGCIVSPYFYIKGTKKVIHSVFAKDIWAGLFLTKLGRTSSMLFNKSIFSCCCWRVALPNAHEYYLLLDCMSSGYYIRVSSSVRTNIFFREGSISNDLSEEKRNNLVYFRIFVFDFLKSMKINNFIHYYYYNISLAKVYKNFNPTYKVRYSRFLYFFHRFFHKYLISLE